MIYEGTSMKIYLVLSFNKENQCRVLSPCYTKRESAENRAKDEGNRKGQERTYHVISKSLKGKLKVKKL